MQGLTAILFPDQGAYRPGALTALRQRSAASAWALERISVAAEGRLDPLLSDDPGRSAGELADADPGLLQLAIFAASVATWAANEGGVPAGSVMLGHGLGEIAALTCAGGYSVADGTRIVLARNEALAQLGPWRGGMVALSLDASRAAAAIRLVDDPTLAVASMNAPTQTVISGSDLALSKLADLARGIDVDCTRLEAPYALHGPLMARAVEPFQAELAGIRPGPLLHRVYSPLLGRYVLDNDDLGGLLVEQFLSPVNLLGAIQDLSIHGVRNYIECGVGRTTIGLARQCIPVAHASTWDDEAPVATDEAPAGGAGGGSLAVAPPSTLLDGAATGRPERVDASAAGAVDTAVRRASGTPLAPVLAPPARGGAPFPTAGRFTAGPVPGSICLPAR
ncbi:acyltransferase domain-containing protein [Actinocatenispora sera]|uniref:[acyl-carrier-protein] S-malonyltransferase n=1 Tax=Actinocatenispora sera TaxID=390989 RepID=A0A810L354_9ACTN|nr:acyltransferase domain-containing protein [Actinocatenispora sera]BCJ29335.1 hypothetical protein Asera_34430 [Actinocatenispora sera]